MGGELIELDFLVEFEVLQLLHLGVGLLDLENLVLDLVDLPEHVREAGVDHLDVVLLAVQVFLQLVVVVLDVLDEAVLLADDGLEVVLEHVHLADGLLEFACDFHVLVADCLQDQLELLVLVPLRRELLLHEVALLEVCLVVQKENH